MKKQATMIYGPDQRVEPHKMVIYGLQWALFMIYGIVWAYSIIGIGAGLSGQELTVFITNVVFTMGVSTLIHASMGHRIGAMSAPTSITLLAVLSAVSLAGRDYGFQAYNAFIIAGIIIAILGFLGVIRYILKIWTPLVLGSMIASFGLSVMKLATQSLAAKGNHWLFWIGILLALLCGYLSLKGKGILATLPALFALVIGYIVFIAAGEFNWEMSRNMPLFTYPQPFPYGFSIPPFELILMMTVVALFNALSCYGNVQGIAAAVDVEIDERRFKKVFAIHGLVETGIAGIFGVPPLAPYAANIGFLMLTGVASRFPVYAAGLLFIALSFLGKAVGFMAAIPEILAGAILMGFAAPLIGAGANVWRSMKEFGTREQFICGFSLFLAMGLSTLGPDFWDGVPQLIATLLTSPSLTTMLFVILLEQIVFRKKKTDG